jgi:hypothetical protein
MPPNDHREGPDEVGTWLVIPYFEDDNGTERPVPSAKAISYLCRSIVVDGQPGVFALRRGQPMQVTVDVANWGAGSLPAVAQIRVWWSDPTVGFAAAHPFGQAVVIVPPDGKPVRSDVMIGTIPETAPNHVCLLANVAAPLDGAGKSAVPDPAGDRRWAQANLTEVVAAADGSFEMPFLAGNPFDAAASARIALRPLGEAELGLMSHMVQRDVRTLQPENVAITAPDGPAGDLVELAPRSQTPLVLRGSFPDGVPEGVEVHLALTQRIEEDGRLLEGSLGVRVAAPR